jgi:drug/metabolite transporter (DMT)-like permease
VADTRGVHVALTIVIAMWGLVFVAISRLLTQLDSVQLVVIRFVLIGLVFAAMFVIVPSTRPRINGWPDLGLFVLIGLLAVPGAQLPIVNGQNYLSPPLVSLVVTTSPAWAAIIAATWLSEPINRLQVVGFVTALVGVSVVIMAGVGDTGLTVENPWRAALILISPISWALFTILSKVHTAKYPPATAIGFAMITGSLSMFWSYPHAIDGLDNISATGWAWMGYLVVGGTVIPYLVWWRALGRLTAATTTAYMYGIPVAALFWSWAILGIVPSIVALLGGVVIIGGVAVIQFARREPPVGSATPGKVPA